MQQLKNNKTPLPYRSDIDGLRAVAVLAVVMFHAFPDKFPGGFIGVDLFFVISGYLITKIIFHELNASSFSFLNFYSRRIRRIFPALIIVLLATYAMGWGTLLASEYMQLSSHVLAGAGFFSNILLWTEIGYFDNSAYTKPLLHLWSLSIEEQFYLIWPVAICIMWRYRKAIPFVIATLIAASFSCGLYSLQQDPGAAFYLPHCRIWELLCGAALAWFETHRSLSCHDNAFVHTGGPVEIPPVQHWSTAAKTGVTCLGFLTLIIACLEFGHGPHFQYPGAWALIPVAVAACLITSGPDTLIHTRCLGHPLFVWFGRISYPIYLWHWPILSIARIANSGVPSASSRLCFIALSVVLAWLTYRLLEQPIRIGASGKKAYAIVILMCLTALIGFKTFELSGLPSRSITALNSIVNSGNDDDTRNLSAPGCGAADRDSARQIPICEHDGRGNVRYAVLGDSKSGSLYPGLVRTSLDGRRWEIAGGSGRFGLIVPLVSDAPELAPMQKPILAALDTIKRNPEIKIVVIASSMRNLFHMNLYDNYLNDLPHSNYFDKAYQGLSNTIAQLVSAHKKVVIVVDNPELPETADCVIRQSPWSWVNALINKDRQKCYIPRTRFLAQTEIYRKLLLAIKAHFLNKVDIFDPTDIYCDKQTGICSPFLNNRRLYSKSDHISDYAAGLVGKELNKFLLTYQINE